MKKIYLLTSSVLALTFANAHSIHSDAVPNNNKQLNAQSEQNITDSKTVSIDDWEFPYTNNKLNLTETSFGNAAVMGINDSHNSSLYRETNGMEADSNPFLSPEDLNQTNSCTKSDFQEMDRFWLKMVTPGNIQVMTAVVYFEGGRDEFWIDDTEGLGGSDELFTIIDGHNLAIQGRAPFRNYDQLQLGYRAFHTGTHIISIYNKEGVFSNGQNIFLVDKELNKVVNLNTNSYKFITRSGEYKNRFLIIYTSSYGNGGGIDISGGLQFTKRDGGVQISSESDKISEVIAYDLNGKPIYKNSNINSNEHTINFSRYSSNIIIVTVRTERGEIFTRKFTNNR
ncbi:MAG: hypothetical protein WBF83_01255 [Moheibacter sp.]